MSRLFSRTWMGLCVLFGLAGVALAQPAEVILIRHAEKPAVGNELNQKGRERAAALVAYFLETPELLEFKTPVAIYAPLATRDHSVRSAETVAPLAEALRIPLNRSFRKDETAQLAHEILHDKRYDGRTVVICWEHKVIPLIAKALGAAGAPDKWHGEAFDRTWVIKFSPGSTPTFQDLPQRLMFGDSTK